MMAAIIMVIVAVVSVMAIIRAVALVVVAVGIPRFPLLADMVTLFASYT
jgi:hypothetical protein